jgi:hypothetical protein
MYFSVPRVSVLVSLVVICLVANAQAPEPQITGRVVRADNGLPIEGAAIELEPAFAMQGNGQLQTALTDSHGQYRAGMAPSRDGSSQRALLDKPNVRLYVNRSGSRSLTPA